MAKAISAAELAKELTTDPSTFRHYLLRHWGDRQRYQRWLFTRRQADKIKAVYQSHGKRLEKGTLGRNATVEKKQLRLLDE